MSRDNQRVTSTIKTSPKSWKVASRLSKRVPRSSKKLTKVKKPPHLKPIQNPPFLPQHLPYLGLWSRIDHFVRFLKSLKTHLYSKIPSQLAPKIKGYRLITSKTLALLPNDDHHLHSIGKTRPHLRQFLAFLTFWSTHSNTKIVKNTIVKQNVNL